MTTRMLIDARHREETRVAVVTGNKIEEFDFESAEHKQLKGNIYLAKVTRVEPSLQAAFVDYGGNRHGFLAFAEIHPDYYQIPKEDRERLLAEEAEAAAEEAALREQEEEEDNEPSRLIRSEEVEEEDSDLIEVDSDDSIDTIDVSEGEEPDLSADDGDDDSEDGADKNDDDNSDDSSSDENGNGEASENQADGEKSDNGRKNGRRNRRGRGRGGRSGNNSNNGRRGHKTKASDEVRTKRMNLRRRYKIQDVIHRRQVLLVQVVKEERGNKGAALTSYLSLAGRYCVLMPNTSHGGGISRKINSAADRKRLKSIISDLTLPSTMGCIIRTAGLARTKPEIKRDFDYLARLWDGIRESTLSAAAPQLIHTDSDLIKRAIRDIYNRDIDEVKVEGADGYKAAKDFMKMLMPSHAKRVQHYEDPVPLFQRYNVEDQLNAMYHPIVQLKSGGYIVINPTEALVSIDINSGRSTKEHGIEATALSTNLEAAKEIARQLRLRDMAGLVVIDFIDMEQNSNNRKIERAMKEALKHDRARIQVGRISSFGLMEMSRQRLRTGVLEASTRECPHCEGTGLVRTESSSALSALRLIEDEAARGTGSIIQLQASQEATIYVLNNKREELAEIEARYNVRVAIQPNGEEEGAKMTVSSSGPRPDRRPAAPVAIQSSDNDDDDDNVSAASEQNEEAQEDGEGRRRKRRRGRRGGRNRNRDQDAEGAENAEANNAESGGSDAGENASAGKDATANDAIGNDGAETAPTDGEEKPKSRRGRRGGRGRNKTDAVDGSPADGDSEAAPAEDAVSENAATEAAPADEKPAEKPKRRSRAKAKKEPVAEAAVEAPAETPVKAEAETAPAEKPKRASRAKAKAKPAEDAADADAAEEKPKKAKAPAKKRAPRKKAVPAAETAEPAAADNAKETTPTTAPAGDDNGGDAAAEEKSSSGGRTGWWQRTFG